MCDFRSIRSDEQGSCTNRTCKNIDRRPKPGEVCPPCESTEISLNDYNCCGLPSCTGRGKGPCGTERCPFTTAPSPSCIGQKCPGLDDALSDDIKTITSDCGLICGNPTCGGGPKYTCIKDGKYECDIKCGIPVCLQEVEKTNKDPVDLLEQLKYLDLSKYTFNKNKYLPKSYLPGDGAGFLHGYRAAPAKTYQVPSKIDDDIAFYKLQQPLPPLPSYNTKTSYDKGECIESLTSNRPYASPVVCPPCGYQFPDTKTADIQNLSSPLKACVIESKPCNATLLNTNDCCSASDCLRKLNQKKKKGCGAPDCKYRGNVESKKAKKPRTDKKKAQGEFGSLRSCDSGVCPFKGMKKESVSDTTACDNPECPFAKGNFECMDVSCPYVKEIEVCEDCGGVIIGEVDIVGQNKKEYTLPTDNATRDDGDADVETAQGDEEKRRAHTLPMKPRKPITVQAEAPGMYTYPGVVLGHRYCLQRKPNVPRNMGWLWTKKPTFGNPELWRGYKPGAVSKIVHKRIQEHRRMHGIYDPSDIIKKKKSKTSQRTVDKMKRYCTVIKRDGNYHVNVNPVKDPQTIDCSESPYIDCTPLQFKVLKERPQKKEKTYDDEGCTCDEDSIEAVQSLSGSSELDFTFSPPAALPKPTQRKKKAIIDKDTQYDKKDAGEDKSSKKKKGKGKNQKKKKT